MGRAVEVMLNITFSKPSLVAASEVGGIFIVAILCQIANSHFPACRFPRSKLERTRMPPWLRRLGIHRPDELSRQDGNLEHYLIGFQYLVLGAVEVLAVDVLSDGAPNTAVGVA